MNDTIFPCVEIDKCMAVCCIENADFNASWVWRAVSVKTITNPRSSRRVFTNPRSAKQVFTNPRNSRQVFTKYQCVFL